MSASTYIAKSLWSEGGNRVRVFILDISRNHVRVDMLNPMFIWLWNILFWKYLLSCCLGQHHDKWLVAKMIFKLGFLKLGQEGKSLTRFDLLTICYTHCKKILKSLYFWVAQKSGLLHWQCAFLACEIGAVHRFTLGWTPSSRSDSSLHSHSNTKKLKLHHHQHQCDQGPYWWAHGRSSE